MNFRSIHYLGVALLMLAGCSPSAPHAGQPTVQGQSMERMRATVDAIRAFARGDTSQAQAEQAATELVSWSGRMGELFPPSEAAQYVGLTPEVARSAPATMLRTSEALLNAVRTGNRQVTGEQLALTEHNGCGACHRQP